METQVDTQVEKLMETVAEFIIQEGGKIPAGYEDSQDVELYRRESYYLSVLSMVDAIVYVFRDDPEYLTRLVLEMNIGLAKRTKEDLFGESAFHDRLHQFLTFVIGEGPALHDTLWENQKVGQRYADACNQKGNRDFIQFGMNQFQAVGAMCFGHLQMAES